VYCITGIAGGALGGTFGVGGGVIMVPALVAMAIPQKEAQGISLAAMVPMALVGSIRYYLNPEIRINIPIAFSVAVGAVVGVFIGSWIAAELPVSALRKGFAILLLLVAARLWSTS
jgi:uncharacterized membrane protein YfcA